MNQKSFHHKVGVLSNFAIHCVVVQRNWLNVQLNFIIFRDTFVSLQKTPPTHIIYYILNPSNSSIMDDFLDHMKPSRNNKGFAKPRKATKSLLRMKTSNMVNEIGSNSLIENSSTDVEYSVNKKQRWQLLDNFRTNMGSINFDDDIRISALEYHTIPGKQQNLLKAFHSLDAEGREIHKYTKKGYGSEKSLNGETSKNSKKKKKKEKSVTENEPISPEPLPHQHIRYEILSQAPHKREMSNKKKNNTSNRSNVKLSTTRYQEEYSNYYYSSSSFDDVSESDEIGDIKSIIGPLTVVNYCSFVSSVKRVKQPSTKSKSVKSKSDCADYSDKPWIRQISTFGEFTVAIDTVSAVTSNAAIHEQHVLDLESNSSNFEIIPIELQCQSEHLVPEFLSASFGPNYIECACLPRRFVIDISDDFLLNAAQLNRNILLKEVKTFVTFEVLDENIDDCVSSVRVSLNANVSKAKGSLSLNSVNPCLVHSIADIIKGAVKTLCSLHLYCFNEAKILRPMETLISKKLKYPLLKINPAQYVASNDSLLSLGCKAFTCENNYCRDTISKTEECSICFMDHAGFRLNICGHYFCNFCWKEYCLEKINSNRVPITCPEQKCSSIVDYWLLITFLPMAKCVTYAIQMRNLEILRQVGQWYWCPTQNCRLLHYTQPTKIRSFHCLCGASWCQDCSGTAHWPVSCESLKRYILKLHENGHDYIPWFDKKEEEHFVKIKKCPSCMQSVEKVEGCDYVTCICSNVFCWRCLKPWSHGFDHFGCKEPEVELEQVEIEDMAKKSDSFLRKTLYSRALSHRKANFPPQVRSFKRGLLKIKCSFKCKFDNNVAQLVKLRNQCHTILENIYIWIGAECRDKVFGQNIKHICHRLEFYLNLLENVFSEKDYSKVINLLNEIDNICDNLISRIIAKMAKN